MPAAPAASNLDAYDRTEDTPLVRPAPPTGGAPAPATGIIFFTIDAATAGAWPAALMIPGPFGPAIPGPSDILAWNPGIGGPVIWATGAQLGLIGGDDVDGLAVMYSSGIPLPPLGPGWMGSPPGADLIVFSLAPGSPSLSPTSGGAAATPLTPACGLGAGTGTAADLWIVGAPVPIGGAAGYFIAESLGLAAARSGPSPDDDVDAIDICNGFVGADTDGDLIDNGCDFDLEGDGIGNTIDNCPTVFNPTQANNDAAPFVYAGFPWLADGAGFPETVNIGGDACDINDDNDLMCTDGEETGAVLSLGGMRDPLNPYDFGDVPTPALPLAGAARSGAGARVDVGAVLSWVGPVTNAGPNGSGRDYDDDNNGNGVEDGSEYDRTPNGQISGPPNGAVSLSDVGVILNQVGDSCTAAPN
jgi:hypothetical protein